MSAPANFAEEAAELADWWKMHTDYLEAVQHATTRQEADDLWDLTDQYKVTKTLIGFQNLIVGEWSDIPVEDFPESVHEFVTTVRTNTKGQS